MNSCETRKCRFWDGEKCNDKNDWISAENGEHCCGLRSDAVLVEKEKRKPLSDGTLPLTAEELEKLSEMIDIPIVRVVFDRRIYVEKASNWEIVTIVEAIRYLAERFELIKED